MFLGPDRQKMMRRKWFYRMMVKSKSTTPILRSTQPPSKHVVELAIISLMLWLLLVVMIIALTPLFMHYERRGQTALTVQLNVGDCGLGWVQPPRLLKGGVL
jgi:hypothetical protein